MQQTPVNESYCGADGISVSTQPAFFSNLSLSAAAVTTIDNANATAIVASTIDNHTVVFMGTSDGRMIKVGVHACWTSRVLGLAAISHTGLNYIRLDIQFRRIIQFSLNFLATVSFIEQHNFIVT